jgi:RNA polymerase sigma factor (sigma-70 family)
MWRDDGKAAAIRSPERCVLSESGSEESDAVLLGRFVDHWDHAAFRDLVRRHGPMVLSVCRRIVRDTHAAEDAFQATFLLLVRKAGSVRKRESVGPWLFGVARRVALEARGAAGPRVSMAIQDRVASSADDPDQLEQDELHAAIHEELGRLPEKYRAPLVLCYLEGLPHDDVARRLGWPIGSVRGRIARGRDLLGARLVRRGLKPAAILLALSLLPKRAGAVPVALVDATVQAAAQTAAREAAPGGEVAARAADLERKVRKAMHMSNLKWIVVAAGMSALVSATLVAVVPGVIAAAADTVEAEKKKLEGTWVPLAVTESGKEQELTDARRIKIEGDIFALMEGDEVHARGPFKLDSSRNPMEIDIAFDFGKMSGKTGRAIYAWDGANLKFCGAIEPHDRPTDFTSTAGDGRLLLLLKRQ